MLYIKVEFLSYDWFYSSGRQFQAQGYCSGVV